MNEIENQVPAQAPEQTNGPANSGSETPYVTANQVMEMTDSITHRVMQELQRSGMANPGGDSQVPMGQIAQYAAQLAAAHVMEAHKPAMVGQIAHQVAGQYGPEVEQEVVKELSRLNGTQIAACVRDPQYQRHLALIARGLHAERQDAPASSPSGTVGGVSAKVNELAAQFMDAYHDVPGFTKELALQMAKERV